MKRTAIALLLLSLPLYAQSFESQADQATRLLQQFRLDKGNGVKTPWNERDKASLAGDAWLEAAKLATTDAQRFTAYESAGLAFAESQALGDDALKAFRLARDVTGASAEQRARAGILAARRSSTREEWQQVVSLAGATPQQLATAYHEIALTYLVPAKADASLNLKVVQNYEKAAEQMLRYDARAADTELGMATVVAQSIPNQSEAVATLDRLYKTLLALPLSPDQKALRNSRLESSWAAGLQKLKALDRAVATWERVGKNPAYPAEQREEALVKAAETLQSQGKPEAALVALQAATPLRADNFVFSTRLAEKKLALLDAQKKPAEALKVVQALAKHPQVTAAARESLQLAQARYLFRMGKAAEAETALAGLWSAPPRGAESLYQVIATRAQDAVDRKDFSGAHAHLDTGLARFQEIQANPARLTYLNARIYATEKNYTRALECYAACCTTAAGITPSETVQKEVRQLLAQALQEKRNAEAQAIATAVASWRVDPMVPALMQAQVAAASGDAASARAAVARCRQELKRFYGAQKEAWEKDIAAVEASLR